MDHSGLSTLAARAGTDLGALGSITKDNTYGATFVGFAISTSLYGILCAQTYTYLRRYPLDKVWYKALVLLLWIIETTHQALIGHAAYYYTITYVRPIVLLLRASPLRPHSNWGNSAILLAAPIWSLVVSVSLHVSVALGALAGSCVKMCFAMRVWRFSGGNNYVTALIVLLTVAQFASACVYTAQGLELSSLLLVHQLKLVGSLSLILGVATDVVTASALCWFLRNLKTGYKQDDSLVNVLTLYAINTGVLTSAVSLATMILYNLMPENFIFMACYFVLSKLYANSFLATLNTRRVTRGRGTDAETATMPTFLMYPPSSHSKVQFYPTDTQGTTALTIGIEQEVTVTRDSGYAI
ncbi:hypothetical protein BC835DRAFT_1414558 [Cytidiella melzeri]|nr:hypothetical protein BC835DRAFT_1414558 [Cytidiella melzeri]